jgi:hypothetical protein
VLVAGAAAQSVARGPPWSRSSPVPPRRQSPPPRRQSVVTGAAQQDLGERGIAVIRAGGMLLVAHAIAGGRLGPVPATGPVVRRDGTAVGGDGAARLLRSSKQPAGAAGTTGTWSLRAGVVSTRSGIDAAVRNRRGDVRVATPRSRNLSSSGSRRARPTPVAAVAVTSIVGVIDHEVVVPVRRDGVERRPDLGERPFRARALDAEVAVVPIYFPRTNGPR